MSVIPPYQELELEPELVQRQKRTRRSKLDMRSPADFVSEGQRVRVAALYWLMRQQHGPRRGYDHSTYAEIRAQLVELVDTSLFNRLTWRASVVFTSSKEARPMPSEVAACCWSVTTSASHPYSFYSHVNSAAHLAQHFRVNVRDVIHEARALKVVLALASDEDKT